MSLLETCHQLLQHVQPVGVSGEVEGVCGLTVSVADFPAPIGAGCGILSRDRQVEGRVIGFSGEQTLVMPLGAMTGIARGDRVVWRHTEAMLPAGEGLLGRVIDGLGRPLDDGPPIAPQRRMPIWPDPIGPMQRRRITEPLATGVRAVDAMLTAGRGQRVGIFSGSGVGKSVLLGMIGRYSQADVNVIALIGERGREVRDFLERDLGGEGRQRSVVVVSTSDEPPLVRLQAAAVATAAAEFFRDRGKHVLLLMDSLTRLAAAQRQIGLAAGEPPATKGYPPSVFSLLPQLLERCGRTGEGSITGFYTVLVEGDDPTEPISDAVRSVADGHVVLSQALAEAGHWPAVDCLRSVSRVMADVTDRRHQDAARDLRTVLADYARIQDLVTLGAYRRGADEAADRAVDAIGRVREFLAQPVDAGATPCETRQRLLALRESVFGPRADRQPPQGGEIRP